MTNLTDLFSRDSFLSNWKALYPSLADDLLSKRSLADLDTEGLSIIGEMIWRFCWQKESIALFDELRKKGLPMEGGYVMPQTRTVTDRTPVSLAAFLLEIDNSEGEAGVVRMVSHLACLGTNLEARNPSGYYPLLQAAFFLPSPDNVDLMETLLDRGANPDGLSGDGETVMSHAIAHEDHDAIRLLVCHGASLNRMDDTSPLGFLLHLHDVQSHRSDLDGEYLETACLMMAHGATLDDALFEGRMPAPGLLRVALDAREMEHSVPQAPVPLTGGRVRL
jgi:hypothetical protein